MLLLTTLGLLAQLQTPRDAALQPPRDAARQAPRDVALQAQPERRPPTLQFPETGMDDTAAYRGYTTRLYRDAARNTLQVYLDRREGRVVHILADADNASIGFSARDGRDRPAPLRWDSVDAEVARDGRSRTFAYRLASEGRELRIGWFLLGSMRVERDFQYWKKHRAPFGAPPFRLDETQRLLAALERLPADVRTRHLAMLGAPDVATLRRRQDATTELTTTSSRWSVRVVQPSLDLRDTMAVELSGDPRTVTVSRQPGRTGAVILRARSGAPLTFQVRLRTTAAALTPLAREEIFTPDFLAFLATAKGEGERSGSETSPASLRARWLERQVRGVELLASREKLMAGLPTYATYFGRDMLVTALMMRPIWRGEMSAFAIGSALRKLAPDGEVSHEEALGGQAVREAAAEYAGLVDAALSAGKGGDAATRDSLLARAGDVLRDRRRVRENYHMIDDEYQLPVLAGRFLADSRVSVDWKRAFLADSSDGGGTRLARLLSELALVVQNAAPYANDPTVARLIAFAPRDATRWSSSSWRDSGVGYANGRYAMDVNAVWVPHALEAVATVLDRLPALGFPLDSLAAVHPALASDAPLGRFARDGALRARTIEAWREAWRHFVVRKSAAEVRESVAARVAAMPPAERAWWQDSAATARTAVTGDSLTFLALSLDADGRPIAVANTDPATRLFLGDAEGDSLTPPSRPSMDAVLRDVRLFTTPYPVGLHIDRVGPVVANDAYAPPAVWRAFVEDAYHGPRVAWGREVNLFLLGAAERYRRAESSDAPGTADYRRELRAAIDSVRKAVEASGFRSELWSYEFPNGRLTPVRYGSGGDVQLWSTTDLVVQYVLSRLSP